jgi:hypothetical protein
MSTSPVVGILIGLGFIGGGWMAWKGKGWGVRDYRSRTATLPMGIPIGIGFMILVIFGKGSTLGLYLASPFIGAGALYFLAWSTFGIPDRLRPPAQRGQRPTCIWRRQTWEQLRAVPRDRPRHEWSGRRHGTPNGKHSRP